jgi:cell division protein FtsL
MAHSAVGEGAFLLLFSAAVIIFLIGLISEQITALNYKGTAD